MPDKGTRVNFLAAAKERSVHADEEMIVVLHETLGSDY